MKYVVIGASAAGINGIRELRKQDKDAEIVLISKDEAIYSRCILHHYLSGVRNLKQLCFVEEDFIESNGVTWMKGCEAVALKTADHLVVLSDGQEVSYDKLLITSGANTFIPMAKGMEDACNYLGFRNIDDADTLKEVAKTAKHVVVLGAGLIGMDAVTGFNHLGVDVTLLHRNKYPLNRQIDAHAAKSYIDAFDAHGIHQYYNVSVEEVHVDDDHKIYELVLSDGNVIPCDYYVVTSGVRANVGWLADSGLELSKSGLVFDEQGKTSDPDVYGAGDVSGLSPIWPAAVKQGIVAADNMAGKKAALTNFFSSVATMSFLGVHTMAVGLANAPDDSYRVDILDKNGVYKKIISKDGMIVGAILQGDMAYGGVLQQLISRKININKIKKPVFDIDYSDFFHEKENLEFSYNKQEDGKNA